MNSPAPHIIGMWKSLSMPLESYQDLLFILLLSLLLEDLF
jgi:hypothetical protein